MGYKRKAQKNVRVTFADDHEFAGLELVTKPLNVAEFAQIAMHMQALSTSLKAEEDPDAAMRGIEAFLGQLGAAQELFAGCLVEWNMEQEDGTPIPADLVGVRSLEDVEFLKLMTEWLEAIGGVPDELGKDSSSGPNSPELSIPMEPLSPSPAN